MVIKSKKCLNVASTGLDIGTTTSFVVGLRRDTMLSHYSRPGIACRVVTVLVLVLMLLSGALVALQGPGATQGQEKNLSMMTNPTSLTPRMTYGLQEDFSDSDLSGWYQWKGVPEATIEVVDGELHLKNYSYGSVHIRHPLNITKQSWNFSMNFRMDDTIAPNNNPYLFIVDSSLYTESPATYSNTAIMIRLRSNLSMELTVDNGLKKGVPTLSYFYSAPMSYDTNYQFYLEFAQTEYDKVRVLVVDKSTDTAHFDQTYTTYSTNINCSRHLPDRIHFGSPNEVVSVYMDWYLDNITAWQWSPNYTGVTKSDTAIESAISDFGEQLLGIEFEANKFRLGYSLTDATWDTSPGYYLEPYIPTNSRDDVAGDIMETASLLYEYTGNADYLTLAQDVWAVLKTHQQPDGGFTFGVNTTDYCMHQARIILGLLALYRVTGDSDYLDEVEGIAPWMLTFQQAAGDCYSRVVRPSTYTIDYDDVETAYFAVSLLEAYKWMGNETYKTKAELALNYLTNKVTVSGRVPSIPDGVPHADNNDVVNAGITLWALSEGYKVLANSTYLDKAQYVAKWLCYAQWANATHAYGFWAGFLKDRVNQSDLLYNYVASLGLSSYQSIVPGNADVNGAIIASLAWVLAAQGHSVSVMGDTLYGTEGVWSAAWNWNDTADQGWTTGWWAEGGWGTWGQNMFYGWQCNIVKFLLDVVTEQTSGVIYERSMVKTNSTGTYRGIFAVSEDSTSVTFTTSSQSHVLVTYENLASTSTIASIVIDAGPTVVTRATLASLSTGSGYRVYQDGDVIATGNGPTLTFTATGGGEFMVEVWYGKQVSTLIVMTVNMVGLGIFVAVVAGWVIPFSRAIKAGTMKTNEQMMKNLMKGVVFIIIALLMWGMLQHIAIG